MKSLIHSLTILALVLVTGSAYAFVSQPGLQDVPALESVDLSGGLDVAISGDSLLEDTSAPQSNDVTPEHYAGGDSLQLHSQRLPDFIEALSTCDAAVLDGVRGQAHLNAARPAPASTFRLKDLRRSGLDLKPDLMSG
jgi:hypothetical protein